ncbi:hypothetical protein BKA62DRAFT_707898 [Auriculariales sp. MPI-PUGE-AT-0066]|nr:hypothetical protein BKA62DRAFT_707898 [Auriculariales sp. MPI-PUGE-AT-0066]
MFATALATVNISGSALLEAATADSCATLANVKWAAPADVRACFSSFAVNETLRSNLLDNFSKLYGGFHTNTNYQIQAPHPFENDVHVDLLKEFDRIRYQEYPSWYDVHLDVQSVLKRTRDGHVGVTNLCFDSVFVSYLPFPLVVADSSNSRGNSIFIAPEASNVSTSEFPDQIDYWQSLDGLNDLTSFDGAEVVQINGIDPWAAVDANARLTGSGQGFSQRQNKFFATYSLASTGWTYNMGEFASLALPTADKVELMIIKKNSIQPITVTVPYRARLSSTTKAWTDADSYFTANCLATSSTNGVDQYATSSVKARDLGRERYFLPEIAPEDSDLPVNVVLSSDKIMNVGLPGDNQPISPTNGSGLVQFFQLDNTTGVLAFGSFQGSTASLQKTLLSGLTDLKNKGVTKLLLDITNNGGGLVCVAYFLHRILAGSRNSTEPLAGMPTALRASPLTRKMVDNILTANVDPDNKSWYNPDGYKFANNTAIPADYNWFTPGQGDVEINGRPNAFSDRIGDTCTPYPVTAPDEPLFDPTKVLLVGNGRCSSSCSLFAIAMTEHYGTQSVVVGGKPGTKQQYSGTVGGQAVTYQQMDTQVKTVKMKDDPLAPPDLLSAIAAGVTWRMSYSLINPDVPEEWQDHPSTGIYTPTLEEVNRPAKIWNVLAKQYFSA